MKQNESDWSVNTLLNTNNLTVPYYQGAVEVFTFCHTESLFYDTCSEAMHHCNIICVFGDYIKSHTMTLNWPSITTTTLLFMLFT